MVYYILNGVVVSWKNFKQKTMMDPTTKVEYTFSFNMIKKIIWIKKLIIELGVGSNIVDLTTLFVIIS